MPDAPDRAPDTRPPADAPPRENADEVDDTIDPQNDVDEALYETFPASDSPGYTGGSVTPSDYEDDEEE
jgi:hypothetical protein